MKRVAVLGATGSIGRQALQVIEANPGLELAAAASGSQPIDSLAPLTQVGGDPTELLEQAEPDVILNAIVGFAGVTATLWALERGIDLALANKESLVAAGDLAAAAREQGGGRLLAVRRLSVPGGPRPRKRPLARAHRLGRAVPGPQPV
jgi:1-deoxy-D-xylulose-5-phosphate reductoisomerase